MRIRRTQWQIPMGALALALLPMFAHAGDAASARAARLAKLEALAQPPVRSADLGRVDHGEVLANDKVAFFDRRGRRAWLLTTHGDCRGAADGQADACRVDAIQPLQGEDLAGLWPNQRSAQVFAVNRDWVAPLKPALSGNSFDTADNRGYAQFTGALGARGVR